MKVRVLRQNDNGDNGDNGDNDVLVIAMSKATKRRTHYDVLRNLKMRDI
jgi:hypothetical protein